MKHPVPLISLCLALAATPALADDDCDAPTRLWQSRDAALEHAARQGWKVERLKIDDGCYEIRGRDAQGRAFKAKLDPQTLSVVKMKVRDSEQDRRSDRERRRERIQDDGRQMNSSPSSTQPPVLTPGTTPRGQIE